MTELQQRKLPFSTVDGLANEVGDAASAGVTHAARMQPHGPDTADAKATLLRSLFQGPGVSRFGRGRRAEIEPIRSGTAQWAAAVELQQSSFRGGSDERGGNRTPGLNFTLEDRCRLGEERCQAHLDMLLSVAIRADLLE